MITLSLQLGAQSSPGLSFSIAESRIDSIYATISAKDLSNEVVQLWYKNEDDKDNQIANWTVDLTAALTLSILLQADLATDIDIFNGNGIAIKDVLVELIT